MSTPLPPLLLSPRMRSSRAPPPPPLSLLPPPPPQHSPPPPPPQLPPAAAQTIIASTIIASRAWRVLPPGAAHMSRTRWCERGASACTGTYVLGGPSPIVRSVPGGADGGLAERLRWKDTFAALQMSRGTRSGPRELWPPRVARRRGRRCEVESIGFPLTPFKTAWGPPRQGGAGAPSSGRRCWVQELVVVV